MDAMQVKPNTNGMVRIQRRGLVKFEFEDDRPFELDVVAVWDDAIALDWTFREKNPDAPDKFIIPVSKTAEWKKATHEFWQATVNDAYTKKAYQPDAPTLTRHETDALAKYVSDKVQELSDFLYPKKDEPSSSPASTEGVQIRFSQ